MSFLQDVFSEQFIFSLGWTLVHSLWQGALIGLGIALSMIFLYKYTAKLRYFINSIGLLAIVALAIVTFFTSYTSYEPEQTKTIQVIGTEQMLSMDQGIVTNTSGESGTAIGGILNYLADYCLEHFPLFVGIWLLGMLGMMLRFLGGYALVRRYRHHKVKPVMGEWERKFQCLTRNVGVRKKVKLLESALVKVPVAIGYLKPVVLVPLGVLNGVPPQQMEAILVHELAHIRRRDYLMNMIQSLLEVIFFYHPVVWWLSGNIRIERENICDDIVITQTGNTMEFAKALTNIQENNLSSPALAAGLSGKNKNRLLNRIRRIAGKPKIHSSFTEGFIAASILLLSLAGLSAAAMINNPTDHELPMALNFDEISETLPGISYYQEDVIAPDTTEKEKTAQYEAQKRQEDQKAIQEAMLENQEVIKAAIALEMEALKEKMRALDEEIEAYVESEDYKEAYRKALQSREEYKDQMRSAMGAYEKAVDEWRSNYQKGTSWTLPQYYHRDANTLIQGDDTLVWHRYAPNVYYYNDSLHEIYIDNWTENWEGAWDVYEDQLTLYEGNLLEAYAEMEQLEELMELAEIEELELPELDYNYDYDFDYDYEYEYKYDSHRNFFVSGNMERIIRDELYEDDLIERRREYIVMIGKKQMLINGEKQSRQTFKKYRRLIDSMEGHLNNEEVSIHIGR